MRFRMCWMFYFGVGCSVVFLCSPTRRSHQLINNLDTLSKKHKYVSLDYWDVDFRLHGLIFRVLNRIVSILPIMLCCWKRCSRMTENFYILFVTMPCWLAPFLLLFLASWLMHICKHHRKIHAHFGSTHKGSQGAMKPNPSIHQAKGRNICWTCR